MPRNRTIKTDDALRMMKKIGAGGGGGIAQETDPTVPSWAKQPTKPTYTADEVGALPKTTKIPSKTSDLTNDSEYITEPKLTDAVSDALTQAKASGEFDGEEGE
ncbi:MAG: hypothetical protein J6U97_01475, partial [Bacteroidaceae bacterium]|nr:hypothetical protein [Bacteroidaceae bacterium]